MMLTMPQIGQPGTDVAWYPSSFAMVTAMLDLAKLRPGDVLIDLGSGDGRVVIEAARRGVRAIGIEDNLELVELSKQQIEEAWYVSDFRFRSLCEIRHQNFMGADLSEATVITMFLDRAPHAKLLKKLAALSGVRIVSNTFHLWEHTAEVTIDDPQFHTARMWELP